MFMPVVELSVGGFKSLVELFRIEFDFKMMSFSSLVHPDRNNERST